MSTPQTGRLVRAAENQSLFREVNERIAQLNETLAPFGEIGDWVCECEDATCVERIPMSLPEYGRLRADGNLFAVKPGHEVLDVEDVIDRLEAYVVVAKRGPGAVYAAEHDPRSQNVDLV